MKNVDALFEKLKTILAKNADTLEVVTDEPGNYTVNTRKLDDKGKPVFFGMVKARKGKVSFHLMPVYCCPELLDNMSDDLRRHMQGKSCFSFSQDEPALLKELTTLTKKGLKAYRADGKA